MKNKIDHGDRSLIFSENNQRPVPVISPDYFRYSQEEIQSIRHKALAVSRHHQQKSTICII